MFPNQTNYRARLTITSQQSLVGVPYALGLPLPGEAEFPSPPAIPSALLRLDLRLSEFVADLHDITDIIRSDIGLTVQALRLAAREIEKSPGKIVSISEIVVDLGVEKLRTLVAGTGALPNQVRNRPGSRVCERFWAHSRLTALVSEELADRSSNVSPEEAYLAGLLCHLSDLPSLLGWVTTDSNAQDSTQIGRRMAQAWGFPRDLVDVIGGDREFCRTHESRALLEIVKDGEIWASRLEFLAARESESFRAKSPPYRLRRG
jgi:HD-like signal output (HDOD) protein